MIIGHMASGQEKKESDDEKGKHEARRHKREKKEPRTRVIVRQGNKSSIR